MNKNTAIKVDNITKAYRIGLKEDMPITLGETLTNLLKAPFRNFRKYRSLYQFDDFNPEQKNGHPSDVIMALKGVSFEVQKGEVVGLIGLNGAGKSTLLKILSRITLPTSGRATIRGKLSSLLEVGTGFHIELTGRENVYLNGTILGMRKKDIDRKFDEIVEFSGVEKFIDTPVKRYSSGMNTRLAFAVAAFLDPEILLIDEVLAVADANFQKKCLKKMHDVTQEGRTVLFVSHSMQAVTRLCPRSILLKGGTVVADGPSHEVVSYYLNSEHTTKVERIWPDLTTAPGDEVIRLCAVRVKTENGQTAEAVDIGQKIGLEMEYEMLEPGHQLMAYYHVIHESGVEAFQPLDNDPLWRKKPRPIGRYVSTAWVPGHFLSEGMYYIGLSIRTLKPEIRRFRVDDAVAIHVIDNMDGHGARVDFAGGIAGVVRPLLKWETEFRPIENSVVSE